MARIQGRDSLSHRTLKPIRTARQRPSPALALFFFILFLGLSAILTGCQAPAKIENVSLAFTTVKKTVLSNLPQGLKFESANGRELTSGYFNPHNWEDDASERSERAFAKVLILNAGRPYSIDVHVFREKKGKGGHYSMVGEDKKLTKELVDKLKEALADRREDRNIIDDFRAF